MNKIIKTLLSVGMALLAFIFFLSSCKKEIVNPSQQLVAISAVFPSSAIAKTPIVIKGVNLKNVNKVQFGTRVVTNFNPSANTDTSVTVLVPDSMALGETFVQVYLNDGAGYAAYKFTVLLTPPVPKINAVTPGTGLPGDVITIAGINFSLVRSVKFAGVNALFSPTADTNTVMKVTIPWNAIGGSQFITLTNLNGSDSIAFTVDLKPVITSFTPSSVHGGDVVTVKGYRFSGASSVKLGSLSTVFNVLNDSTLSLTVPTGALSGNVTIVTPNGTGVSGNALTVLVAGIAFPLWDEGLSSNWNGWIGGGWGGASPAYDQANSSPVRNGAKSLKINYSGQWGVPFQLGGATIPLSAYTTLKISIYGGPGTANKRVNIGFNEQDGKTIDLVAGVWTDYTIPLSDISNATTLTHLYIKEYSAISGVGDYTIYIDDLGLN
jgi:IPT/TIG domain